MDKIRDAYNEDVRDIKASDDDDGLPATTGYEEEESDEEEEDDGLPATTGYERDRVIQSLLFKKPR